MKKKLAVMLATWFWSGLIPPILVNGMAGTYGSFFALPLCYAAILATGYWYYSYGPIMSIICLIGLFSVSVAEVELGPRICWRGKVKERDQNQIVIDEVFGMLITCFPLLFFKTLPLYQELIIAFFLFRIFDVMKPWPASIFDRMENNIGVMIDDAVAGAYAAISLTVILLIFG